MATLEYLKKKKIERSLAEAFFRQGASFTEVRVQCPNLNFKELKAAAKRAGAWDREVARYRGG